MKRVKINIKDKEGKDKDVYVDIDEKTIEVLDMCENREIANMYLIDEYIQNKKEREHERRKVNVDNYEMTDTGYDLCEEYIKNETIEKLREAIKKLNGNQVELISKIFYENKSIGSVAKEQGVGRSTIKAKLKRIYEKLRKELTNKK